MILDGKDDAHIAQAVALLRAGEVVAMPTETVYGLAADAANRAAVRRIFALKGRPADHPVIVHLGARDQVTRWAREIPAAARMLIERFWPGPLTLILPAAGAVLPEVTGGQPTVGLRMPSHPVALALLQAFGGGLAAPSANRFGRISPTCAAHVASEFGDAVGIILDGGVCEVGLESTILDLSGLGDGGRPRLLRPGAIAAETLAEALGEPLEGMPALPAAGVPRVPGSLVAHYAPRTPLRLVSSTRLNEAVGAGLAAGRRLAVLALRDGADAASVTGWRVMSADAMAYGHDLYAQLRALDELGCDVLLVEQPPDTPSWRAVNDRLQRAACGSLAAD